MFAPMIDDPDYGVLWVAHHRCRYTDAAGERQLVMGTLKLLRRLDPDGFEARADTEALRRRLDELAIPAGRQPYVAPFDAIADAVARADAEADGVVVDHGAVAAWLDTASRDFDVDPEGAA